MTSGCAIAGCGAPVDPHAPLELCTSHLLAAHDWVAREAGVTDVLPSPCLACGSRLGVRYPSGWLCAVCEWRVGALPEGDAAPRIDVVYYLRYRDRIKIGTSANPRLRFAALPHDEVLAFERGAGNSNSVVTRSSPGRGCRDPSGSAPATSSRRTSPSSARMSRGASTPCGSARSSRCGDSRERRDAELRQAVREHEPGRAGTDDEHIGGEVLVRHGPDLLSLQELPVAGDESHLWEGAEEHRVGHQPAKQAIPV